MCKVYTGYCGTSEIEHGLCACTVDNPLAKAWGLSLRTSVQAHKPCSISHLYITNAKQYRYRLGAVRGIGAGSPFQRQKKIKIKTKSMLVTDMQLVRSTTLYITDVKKYRYNTQECVEGGGVL